MLAELLSASERERSRAHGATEQTFKDAIKEVVADSRGKLAAAAAEALCWEVTDLPPTLDELRLYERRNLQVLDRKAKQVRECG